MAVSKAASYRDIFKHALSGIQKDLDDPTLSEEERIDLALVLWKARDRADSILTPTKRHFRKKASDNRVDGSNQVRFSGKEGTCLIVFPETHLRLRENADVAALKVALGAQFRELFETKERYIPRPDLLSEHTLGVAPSGRSVLLNSIEQHDPTPRVYFNEKDPWEM